MMGGNFSILDYFSGTKSPWCWATWGGLAFTGLTLYVTHIRTAPKRKLVWKRPWGDTLRKSASDSNSDPGHKAANQDFHGACVPVGPALAKAKAWPWRWPTASAAATSATSPAQPPCMRLLQGLLLRPTPGRAPLGAVRAGRHQLLAVRANRQGAPPLRCRPGPCVHPQRTGPQVGHCTLFPWAMHASTACRARRWSSSRRTIVCSCPAPQPPGPAPWVFTPSSTSITARYHSARRHLRAGHGWRARACARLLHHPDAAGPRGRPGPGRPRHRGRGPAPRQPRQPDAAGGAHRRTALRDSSELQRQRAACACRRCWPRATPWTATRSCASCMPATAATSTWPPTRTPANRWCSNPSIDLQATGTPLTAFCWRNGLPAASTAPMPRAVAGTTGARHLFVALEHVQGQTLAQWMIDHPARACRGARHRGADRPRPAGFSPAWRCCTRTCAREHHDRPHRHGEDHRLWCGTRGPGWPKLAVHGGSAAILGTVQYTAPSISGAGQAHRNQTSFPSVSSPYQMLTGRLPYGAGGGPAHRAALSRLRYASALHDETARFPPGSMPCWNARCTPTRSNARPGCRVRARTAPASAATLAAPAHRWPAQSIDVLARHGTGAGDHCRGVAGLAAQARLTSGHKACMVSGTALEHETPPCPTPSTARHAPCAKPAPSAPTAAWAAASSSKARARRSPACAATRTTSQLRPPVQQGASLHPPPPATPSRCKPACSTPAARCTRRRTPDHRLGQDPGPGHRTLCPHHHRARTGCRGLHISGQLLTGTTTSSTNWPGAWSAPTTSTPTRACA